MENMPMGQVPIQNPQQNNFQAQVQGPVQNNSIQYRPKRILGKVIFIIVVLVLILAIAGGIYAYVMKIGPFAVTQYTEKNLLSGILKATSNIKSSSYTASGSLIMDKRDVDAKPFNSKLTNTDQIKKQYENDSRRAEDIGYIMGKLSNTKYIYDIKTKKTVASKVAYPSDLKAIADELKKNSSYSYYKDISINDPSTGKPYIYSATNNGDNFSLIVTFETNDVIAAVKKSYKFSNSTTKINGKTVTFTKDSPTYFYLSKTPPDPFMISLEKSLANLPSETKVSSSISAQTDWGNKDSTDWKFNVDATGDLGDMTYKFNFDALRKAQIYYFKINNIPGLFLSFIGIDKGQWISVDPSKQATGTYSYDPLNTESLSETEKYYKDHRQEIMDLLQKIITTADNDNLIAFKNPPRSESVDGKNLFRYDLEIRKDSIVKFYKDFQQAVINSNLKDYNQMFLDSGYINYLQSPEFSEIFDYYQKNTSLTLWTDQQGYPAIISYSVRIVPEDSATKLKDKQANINFKLKISDINKPVNIEAPKDAKDIKEYFKSNSYTLF